MNYEQFIRIFNKDYDFNDFYFIFLKKKKKIENLLKGEIDNVFLLFILKEKIEKEEEIKAFFWLYNNKLDINFIYFYYRNNFLNLEELKRIRNMDDLKYFVVKKYNQYFKKDIDKIDKIDLNNIFVFINKYPKFYEKMDGNKYIGNIKLNRLNISKFYIKKDLNFLNILGIEEIKGYFECNNNKDLKSLRGCPSYIDNYFDCNNCGLEEIGMEKKVRIGGYFNCSKNENLKSLKGSPNLVEGDFCCSNCGLEELSMEDGVVIKGNFNCRDNKNLKNLKNGPSFVGGNFVCSYCGIEKLGMQKGVNVKGDFYCSENKNLKSLEGSPSWIGGNFSCYYCNLNEIDLDKGIMIEKNLYCLEGNNVTKEQVERYIKENNINLKGGIR